MVAIIDIGKFWLYCFGLFCLLGSGNSTKRSGYGNCQRLVGKSCTNVVQRFQGDFIMTTLNLHVIPPTGYDEDEVFKVSLKQYAQDKDKVWLTSFVRQSKYSKFKSCADNSVDIKLCACAKDETTRATRSGETTANGVPRKMFGSETIVMLPLIFETKLRKSCSCHRSDKRVQRSYIQI